MRARRHSEDLVDSRGSVRGWLLTVVHDLVTDAARARAVHPREVGEVPTAVPQRDHADRVVAALAVREVLTPAGPAR